MGFNYDTCVVIPKKFCSGQPFCLNKEYQHKELQNFQHDKIFLSTRHIQLKGNDFYLFSLKCNLHKYCFPQEMYTTHQRT